MYDNLVYTNVVFVAYVGLTVMARTEKQNDTKTRTTS